MKKIIYFFRRFVYSFKPKLSWLYMAILDLIFYGAASLAVKLTGSFLTRKSAGIDLPLTSDLTKLPTAQLELLTGQIQNLFISIVVSSLLLLIILLVGWSLTRGMIYSLLLNKKFTKKYFKKFTLLNLFLFAVLTVILVFFTSIGLLLRDIVPYYNYVFYFVLLAIAYYLSVNYIIFTRKNLVFDSIGKSLVFGTKKLPKLFIPCIFILIISLFVQGIHTLMPVQSAPILTLIVFTIFMAWARTFFVQEAEKANFKNN